MYMVRVQVYHQSNHSYNITLWEIFNEPIAEHKHTKESYTLEYDAIVQGLSVVTTNGYIELFDCIPTFCSLLPE